METDADPSSEDKKGEMQTYTINPGSFNVFAFAPQSLLKLDFYDHPLPTLPPIPRGATSDEEITTLLNESRVMRCRRLRRYPLLKNSASALYQKYHSLANERKLRFAASTCNVELLCEMLDRGTSPNCYDEHKRSPLHLAACRGYGDIITILLQHGANPNIVDSLGNTPLHLSVISASSRKFNNVVRILLNHGASVHVLDRTGKNPLELAQKKLKIMKYRNEHPTPEMREILQDLCVLVALILKHFLKEKEDIDNLTAIEEKLSNLSTNDSPINPMDDADALLAKVEKLKL